MGRISDRDLSLAYQAADVFLLPTRDLECFGLIILEALSYGCPLIATDAGALPEILGSMVGNAIVPAGDVGRLAEKLGAMIDGRLAFPESRQLMDAVVSMYGRRR